MMVLVDGYGRWFCCWRKCNCLALVPAGLPGQWRPSHEAEVGPSEFSSTYGAIGSLTNRDRSRDLSISPWVAVATTGDVGPVVVSPGHVSSGGRLSLPTRTELLLV